MDDGPDERRSQLERRILDAARDCFERFGVARTRVEDVANAAGISRPLLYQHHRDRAALIEAVINDELARLVEALRQVPLGPSFAASVVELSAASVEIARRDQLLNDLFQHSAYADLPWQLQHPSRPAYPRVLGLWRPVMAQGREEGTLRTDVPEDELVQWVMMTHHLFVQRADLPMDRVRDMFATFLVPGLTTTGPSIRRPRSAAPEPAVVRRRTRARRR